jgi:hypothetical protein
MAKDNGVESCHNSVHDIFLRLLINHSFLFISNIFHKKDSEWKKNQTAEDEKVFSLADQSQ